MTWLATLGVVGRVGRSDASDKPPSLKHLKSQRNIIICITLRPFVIGEGSNSREGCRTRVRHVRQKITLTVKSTP